MWFQGKETVEYGDFAIVTTKDQDQMFASITSAEKSHLAQRINTMKSNLFQSYSINGAKEVEKADAPKKEIVVELSDLEIALKGLNPSLSPQERRRYEDLYSHFMNSHQGSFNDASKEPKKQSLM